MNKYLALFLVFGVLCFMALSVEAEAKKGKMKFSKALDIDLDDEGDDDDGEDDDDNYQQPGFEGIFALTGILAVAYLCLRRRD